MHSVHQKVTHAKTNMQLKVAGLFRLARPFSGQQPLKVDFVNKILVKF